EVAPMGQPSFKRLAEVDIFRVHLAKAEAKWRVDKLARDHEVKNVRTRNTKIGVVAAICGVVAIGAGTAAWYLAIHKPWADADELAFADISVEPPTITLASKSSNEELVEYAMAGDKTGRKVSDRIAERTKGQSDKTGDRTPGEKRSGEKLAQRPGKVGGEEAEADGLKTEMFDRSMIDRVVKSKQTSLYPCLIEEAKRRPGFSAKIPIEFVIGNDGRVNKLWVDNPDFKTGTLPECLLKELQRWPFKPYQGEQATVGLQFKIGKGS
ncbi:MAG TPA: AgmX/PglI C-terminal domain-containing protein, partial [Myxococcaceae bacterium]|nr:AgmX/PglI C-terminal domain-containing protein [Myxococcaceae bacterium]